MIEARRPNIVVVDKVRKETMIIDMAIPGETRRFDKDSEKNKKYSLLKGEIARLWQKKRLL